MRRTSILIILILIVGTLPLTSAKGVSEPVQRDVFLYQYFSQVLIRFEYSLEYATMNNTYSVKLANMTLNELRVINQETLYYQERGVNSTVTNVIPPFYKFSEELLTLANLTLEFQENSSRELAAGILSTINKMERQLRAISLLKLRNGTKVLTFNTQEVQKQLDIIKKMAISKLPPQKSFSVGISDNNPILHQNVTIFGSSPWNDTITVVIKSANKSLMLQLTPSNGLFSTTYQFNSVGHYTIQAFHGTNRSNTVDVAVRKIPTMFIVDNPQRALLNHTLTISGILVDYYGNRLADRQIRIGNETTTTNNTGGFSTVYFSQTAKEFTVTLIFPGDEEHAPTSKTVEVIFTRYPVSITLTGPTQLTLGETATFRGNLNPPIWANLTVYVDGKEYSNITTENGSFSFQITPKKTGETRVYVEFPGNDKYEKATSEVIVLMVTAPENTTIRYIGAVVLGILLITGAVISRRKHKPEITKRKEDEVKVVEGVERAVPVPKDVGEAYTFLRGLLKEAFGLDESLTPREILKLLQGWEMYPLLEKVTLLHEKAVYGGTPLAPHELRDFEETLENLIRGLSP